MKFFKRPGVMEIQAIAMGALGFSVASMAVFGSWAFAGRWMYARLGELGAYAVWALMFVVIAGATLRKLVSGHKTFGNFHVVFAMAFLLYAAGWTVAWFSLRNRGGEWLASLLGTVLMALVFLSAFSAWPKTLRVIATLFLSHSFGYFLGGFLHATLGGRPGMLLWGLSYGLGFGAGIGRALFLCQLGRESS
jgi:hypothetical protein